MTTLQALFDDAQSPKSDTANRSNAIVALAQANEIEALIRVYDTIKASKAKPSDAAMRAMQRLHDTRAKPAQPSLVRICHEGRRLVPTRRLHKIFKGKRMSQRSSDAKPFLKDPRVMSLKDQAQAADTTKVRIALAKDIKKMLSVPLETARGIVTALKRMR